ncbi:rhomboid family intramembrane serine protease [Actinomadura parmotrematis]|uniref:Rhomboid family intramembrane serine protease n=1 Tax=Actinomadura parmotrematis TaxID=2864039 RepID=A0ABS7FR70_9ACTN|nr:rhomboid family intramembrane serine protease [Actinomadura parmotrematis]MBW8482872.1 rhomboid family intramembrane serine protease [Actinomadura parmotrematis]
MQTTRRRPPLLTALVFAATASVNAAQLAHPGLLERLERAPAGLHGDWWRTFTALLVQDGGAAGAAVNLTFLLLVGAAAEQVLTRPRWLLQYFGTGLLAELAGYAWQPTGGGNSIAICGLAGGVAVALWRREADLPPAGPAVVAAWAWLMIGTLGGTVFPLAVAGLAVTVPLLARAGGRAGRATTIVVAAAGALLAAAQNIHGAALLIGLALGALIRRGTAPRS